MTATTTSSPRVGKLLLQSILGGIAGAGSVSLMLTLFGRERVGVVDVDEIVTIGVAAIFLLMGLFVGIGSLFPKAGSKVLNVSDEEELLEQRRMIGWGAIGSILIGVALLALMLASPAFAILDAPVAAGLFVAAMLGLGGVWWASRNEGDELNQAINRDAAVLSGAWQLTLFGGWAVAAQFGYATMFAPLTFISGALALYLVCVFWVVGKRGLMVK